MNKKRALATPYSSYISYIIVKNARAGYSLSNLMLIIEKKLVAVFDTTRKSIICSV